MLGDSLDEANETFVVNLSNGSNVTISDNHATETINDNDPVSLQIDDKALSGAERARDIHVHGDISLPQHRKP